MRLTASATFCSLRPLMMTSARSRASPRAMAKPMPAVDPVIRARLPRSFKSMISVFPCGSAVSRKPREAGLEIGLQVLDVLETYMETNRGARSSPRGRSAIIARVERQDEALEATPGIAHAEQADAVEHGGKRAVRYGLQDESKQARGAGEVAGPESVAGI